jgi:hypothetical protein
VGEVVASAAASSLAAKAIALTKKFLPAKVISVAGCDLSILQIQKLDVSSKNNELYVSATALAESCLFPHQSSVTLDIQLQPDITKNKMGWKIMRLPTLGIPFSWKVIAWVKGNPDKSAQEAVKNYLDAYATFTVPEFEGIRTSLQGANFAGDSNIVSFRVVADSHIDGPNATKLFADVLGKFPLKFILPAQVAETPDPEKQTASLP